MWSGRCCSKQLKAVQVCKVSFLIIDAVREKQVGGKLQFLSAQRRDLGWGTEKIMLRFGGGQKTYVATCG